MVGRNLIEFHSDRRDQKKLLRNSTSNTRAVAPDTLVRLGLVKFKVKILVSTAMSISFLVLTANLVDILTPEMLLFDQCLCMSYKTGRN